MTLHVPLPKSVVAYLVLTRSLNGSKSSNTDVTFVELLHLSLIGGFVADAVCKMLTKHVNVMNVRMIKLNDIGGVEGIFIVLSIATSISVVCCSSVLSDYAFRFIVLPRSPLNVILLMLTNEHGITNLRKARNCEHKMGYI